MINSSKAQRKVLELGNSILRMVDSNSKLTWFIKVTKTPEIMEFLKSNGIPYVSQGNKHVKVYVGPEIQTLNDILSQLGCKISKEGISSEVTAPVIPYSQEI